jgi:hypothetical protein
MKATITINVEGDEQGIFERCLVNVIGRLIRAVGIPVQSLNYAVSFESPDVNHISALGQLTTAEITATLQTQSQVTAARSETDRRQIAIEQLRQVVIPSTCDGLEQPAFEAIAAARGYNMEEHPMFYIFLNEKTSAMREGWREAINWVNKTLTAAIGQLDTAVATPSDPVQPTGMTTESAIQHNADLHQADHPDLSIADMIALIDQSGITLTEEDALELATHRHYKGGLYRRLFTARHTETEEQVIVYMHLYPHNPAVYVRPKSMFEGKLDGGRVRFAKLQTLSAVLDELVTERIKGLQPGDSARPTLLCDYMERSFQARRQAKQQMQEQGPDTGGSRGMGGDQGDVAEQSNLHRLYFSHPEDIE